MSKKSIYSKHIIKLNDDNDLPTMKYKKSTQKMNQLSVTYAK
jgi:hypothetical protein